MNDPADEAAGYLRQGLPIPPGVAEQLRRWAEKESRPEWLHPDLVRYSDLTGEHVDWIIPGLIPCGMLSVLAGEQGLGKSLLHARWASNLSREQKSSVLVSAEDSPTHTTKWRLGAAEADQTYIYHAAILPVLGNGKDPEWLARIREWIATTRAVMLVLDPLNAFLDAQTDSYKDQHVRHVLASIDGVARETGCGIVYVMHLTKATGNNPLQRIAGSVAFTAAARSVVLMAPETDAQAPERLVAHVKCNVAEKAPTQRWRVNPILIPGQNGARDSRTARLDYLGLSDVDVYTLLAPREDSDGKSERDEAKEIIVLMLTSGDCLSSDLERAVRESGISARTYDTARRELGVRAFQRGRKWYSRIVTSQDANAQDANWGLRPDDPFTGDDDIPF
jgi:hypothetical protein